MNELKTQRNVPEDRLLLNRQVVKIDWSSSADTDAGEIRVLTADEEEIVCEKVLVTVPLGVLKDSGGGIQFLPSLPSEKMAAIDVSCFEILFELIFPLSVIVM
jgi:hypothetical protein